jgi:tetratricopeptide (TPR) repeat protein
MNFICSTETCAIAKSKASFPVAMPCPVCNQPLAEIAVTPALSEKDIALLNKLPYVIAFPHKRAILEKHPWTRVNLLKDTFLNYLKYLGLLTASEFFNSNLKDKKMVALFQQALAEPSFGSWNQYIRETLQFLKEQQHAFFCADLLSYYETVETGKKRKLYKGEIEYIDSNGDVQLKKQEATAIGMLINFRNRYLGHGLTLDEKAAQQLWDEYYPIFSQLLEQMSFCEHYPMFKHEHGESYILKTAELVVAEKGGQTPARVWIENIKEASMDIIPFFVVPGEVSIGKDDKEQILTYESYTGKTIKFFSPEGTEKQTSGKILEKLNLLLRDKQKEKPYTPEEFTKEIFMARVADENKLILDTLIAEKKVIPGVYVHREDMEIKLREWIGARMSIFFIAAEAGSGKTNLLVEMQKQYSKRAIPSLLIRAGRMEKQTLREQLAYLLNIDATQELSNYGHIAGTQASPTMVLIDGLNEASKAEALWHEVLEISKIVEPGSLKFVVTSRANSKVDIERYALAESDESLVYGENKDRKRGLGAYTHWLTALNMAEMKNAWDDYVQKDRNKYKPQFSFDDLATFDRGLYDQISNPLVLRLFLETYHNKALPKKGNKHLNIWADWLATFIDAEQAFFNLLADAIWEKGENELFLDDVLKNENLKPYFTDDRINAPYQRLKNNGWISRYVKDLNACVAFTMEGALLFILGKKLQNRSKEISIEFIDEILEQGRKLQKAGLETFLCEEAMRGELGLITNLIDTGGDKLNISIRPLLHFLKSFGVEATLSKLLEDTTENDWKAMLKLNKMLDELQLQVLRKDLLSEAITRNLFSNKYDTELGLIAIQAIDDEQAQYYYTKIDGKSDFLQHEAELLFALGNCEKQFSRFDNALEFYQKGLAIELINRGSEHPYVANSHETIGLLWNYKGFYDKALDFYQRSLDIRLKSLGLAHPDLAYSYANIGVVWANKGEHDKALEYYQKGLEIGLNNLGGEHPNVGGFYNNIGLLLKNKGEYDNALEFYHKCLDIELKTFGGEHPSLANSYNNIGSTCNIKGEYDNALDYYQKCLDIQLRILGGEHPSVANSYSNIGVVWDNKGEYDKALDFYQKSLDIRIKKLGGEHPDVAISLSNIGVVWDSKGEYDKAIDFYQKSLDIKLKTLGGEHPSLAKSYGNIGVACNKKGEYDKALYFHQKCLDIQMKTIGGEHPSVATTYSNIGATWDLKSEYDKALEFYQKCQDIQIKKLGGDHPNVAIVYSNIGVLWDNKGDYDKALEFYQKCQDIQIKNLGGDHPNVATVYSNIGVLWDNIGEYGKALEFYHKCVDIQIKNLGGEHPDVAISYYSIGEAYNNIGEYGKALEFYQKCLNIRLKILGSEHPYIANTYFDIGLCYQKLDSYQLAIESFLLGYKIQSKGGYLFRIAASYEKLGNKQDALDYFIQSAEIRKNDPEAGLKDEATLESIENSRRLATQLNKIETLPEWIRAMH